MRRVFRDGTWWECFCGMEWWLTLGADKPCSPQEKPCLLCRWWIVRRVLGIFKVG